MLVSYSIDFLYKFRSFAVVYSLQKCHDESTAFALLAYRLKK